MAKRNKEFETVNDWISCNERYPDIGKYILLSFENFSVPCVGRYEENEEGGAFYIGDDSETCTMNDLIVNAWMPLPKCYEESLNGDIGEQDISKMEQPAAGSKPKEEYGIRDYLHELNIFCRDWELDKAPMEELQKAYGNAIDLAAALERMMINHGKI